MVLSQREARLSGPSLRKFWQRYTAVFGLVMLMGFAGSAHAQTAERKLDWDTVAWTPRALSQTYNISGRNIVVTYAGGRGGNLALVNPAPGLENINTGGLLANQFSLNVQTEYLTVPPGNPDPLTNENFVTVTMDFTDFPDGISGVDFNIFDIDRGPRDPITGNIGFSDWVQVSAQTTGGATVTPVCTTGGRPPADFAAPSPAPSFSIAPGCILSGTSRSAPTSTDGTANIMFPQTNIRSVTVTYRNNTTNPTPALQLINIHDVRFLPAADISVDKVVDNATPVVGTNVQYTITMANAGPGDGTGLVLEDRLPAGLTYVSSSDGGVYNPATRTVTWPTLALLGSGAAVVRTLTATVNPVGPYLNVAELTAATNTDPDSTPGNNILAEDDQDDAPITPNPFADLSLTKIVDNATPNVGNNVTFTITLTNDGPVDGTGITVADNLPSGFALVSTTPSVGAYDPATGIWTVGNLAATATATLQIVATTLATGDYTNIAQVQTADQPDQDSTPGNNVPAEDDQDDAVVMPIMFADLRLTKAVDTSDPVVGANVTFTITLTNDGPVDGTGITVADNLPSGFALVSTTPSVGAYDPATGIWTVGNLAAAASATLQVVATTLGTGDYTNIAQVQTADQPDPDSTPGNNVPGEDDQDAAPVTPILLGVAKSVSTGPVNNGGGTFSFDYSIRVQNYGAAPISNLQVIDDLAATFTGAVGFAVDGLASADFTLNPLFNGLADTNLLTGVDVLAVGQTGTIVVSITLTPGGNLGPYNNSAVANGTGPAGTPVADTSQQGVNPDPDNNGDPRDNNVPTPVTVSESPAITVDKQVQAAPVVNADGTSTLTYSMVVTNTGDVVLSNVQVLDNLAAAFAAADSFTVDAVNSADFTVNPAFDGNATTTLLTGTDALAVGAAGTISVTLTVQPGANLGPYINAATASGVSPAGTNVSATDNAPVVNFAENPVIGTNKRVVAGPLNNGNGTYTVTYELGLENFGNVPLANVQVTDDFAASFAAAGGFAVDTVTSGDFAVNPGFNGVGDINVLAGTDTLAVGARGNISITVTVNPGGNFGVYNNSATGSGTSPAGTTVQDVSNDGIDPDPDNNNDPTDNNVPTPVTFSESPTITVDKQVQTAPVANADGTSTLTYNMVVANTGDVVLSNVQIVDDLATAFAAADSFTVDAVNSADFAVNPAFDGTATTTLLAGTDALAIGAMGSVSVTLTVRPGANLGPYVNSATASGVSPAGTTVNATANAPLVNFAENPLIGTNKRVVTGPVNNGDGTFTVTYELGLENFGNVALANVQITDDFAASFAAAAGFTIDAVTSGDFAVNPAFDGIGDINVLNGTDTLATGARGAVSVTVTINPGGNFGVYNNSATGSGTSPAGTTVQDVSNDGIDPDPDNNNDPTDNNVPTPITLAESPSLGVAKEVSTAPVSNNNGTFTFSYTMNVQNYGDVNLAALQVSDDLATAFAAANAFVVNAVQSNDFTVNGGFDGAGDTNLLAGTDTLAIGARGQIIVTLTVTPGGFPGPYLNTAVGTGTSPGGTPVQDDSTVGTDPDPDGDGNPGNNMVPTPVTFAAPEIAVTKRADPTVTVTGGLVRYTITVTNRGNDAINGLTLQDVTPAGFNFADGSAVLDGRGALTVNGQRPVNFGGINLNPGESATLVYILRVGAGVVPGFYPNVVTPLFQGNPVGDPATARVEIVADPDINETTIMGKVFTDHNENGYQDEGESGIGGVRLATVEGLRVETDAEGRYHIAAVDGGFMERGRNYIIKVDPATLPPGSEFTTENPRVKRITQGLMNRFDFGVKVPAFATERTGRIKVKLAEVFFLPGSDQVHPDFLPSIGELAGLLRKHGGGILYIDGHGPCQAPPAPKVYTDEETLSYTFTPRFGVRKATLTAEDRAELDRALASWRDALDVSILSIGHTSSVRIAPENRHEFADNYALGEARAAAVANYVRASLGIDTANVQAIGRGPDQPVASNTTAEGRALNRRVELILSGKRKVQRQERVDAPPCDMSLAKRRAEHVFETLKPLIGDDLINSVQVLSAPPP